MRGTPTLKLPMPVVVRLARHVHERWAKARVALLATAWIALQATPALAANATITWGFSPTPTAVTINAGETVTWSGDLFFHPVALTNASFSTLGAIQSSGGASYTRSFATPGVYYFMCAAHLSSMPTTVTVCAVPAAPLVALDIDGDGSVDALTDGLLVLRYLLGFRNDALVAGAVSTCASRNTAAIQAYLASSSGLPQ
jgi:plastocyanin